MTTLDRASRPLRLGFLAFVEHTGIDGNRSAGLQQGLDLFSFAEDLGYDTGWVRNRHLEKYLSSPLTFLTAAAARTSDIRLGTAVIPIRHENPVRLAEDAATADLLSGGRLELGVSSGYANAESVLGTVFDEGPRDFEDEVDHRLRRFQRALSGETLAVADETFPVAPAGTELRAEPHSPGLADRLYYGAGSSRSAIRAGGLGLRLQLSTLNTQVGEVSFEQAQADIIAEYRAAHETSAATTPSIAVVSRQVLPILTTQDADDFAWLIERSENRQNGTDTALPFQFGIAHSGGPDEILARLAADEGIAAADELVIALPFDHSDRVLRHTLKVVAEQIAPGLGWVAG